MISRTAILVLVPLLAGILLLAPSFAGEDHDFDVRGAPQLEGTAFHEGLLFKQSFYWDGANRSLATSPLGNIAAISAHNCYTVSTNPSSSLSATLVKIHDAQAKGADLIELDVKYEGGTIYVDHDDDGGTEGAYLSQVLFDSALMAGNQILFIESKEKTPDTTYITVLLNLLSEYDYARMGRPVVIRAFHSIRQNLEMTRDVLDAPPYWHIRPWVKLSELFSKDQVTNIAQFQQLILDSKNDQFHGVEFHYQDRNIFGKLTYARNLGLGINVWTIPASVGEVFVADLREEVDAITVDYPLDKARQVVEDNNVLIYMNAWNQDGAGNVVEWIDEFGFTNQSPVNTTNAPDFNTWATGEDLYGGVLTFHAASQEIIRYYDADNDPGEGFFVTAVVNFDDLTIADGDTMAILNKSDAAGFALELFNPVGSVETVLRFGVYVGGYVYATYPASYLNLDDSYFLTGAYDGDGGIWLWINNTHDNVTNGSATGGVAQNDSPVLLGADPQGAQSSRFHFSGKIQQACVLRWGAH